MGLFSSCENWKLYCGIIASEVVHAHCKQKLDAAAQLLESVWDEVVQQAGDCYVNDAGTNLSCKEAEFAPFVWA